LTGLLLCNDHGRDTLSVRSLRELLSVPKGYWVEIYGNGIAQSR